MARCAAGEVQAGRQRQAAGVYVSESDYIHISFSDADDIATLPSFSHVPLIILLFCPIRDIFII